METGIQFRAVSPGDYDQALALWDRAFQPGKGYFERYFRDDPWYQPGDCLGAWDGERLVSAVFLGRRPVEWAGRTLWCGAIANVATDPEYRRQGLSREILGRVIERMEAERLDFSMLFTGVHAHYAALGWEQVENPAARVRLAESLPGTSVELREEAGVGELAELYWQVPPRPLLLHRPDRYYQGWVGWNWTEHGVVALGDPELGFVALRLEGEEPGWAEAAEWHAMDAEAERELLRAAAVRARAAGKSGLSLAGVPYYEGLAALAGLGEAERVPVGHMMLRNVGLAAEEYAEVKRLYASGDAVWWPSDGF